MSDVLFGSPPKMKQGPSIITPDQAGMLGNYLIPMLMQDIAFLQQTRAERERLQKNILGQGSATGVADSINRQGNFNSSAYNQSAMRALAQMRGAGLGAGIQSGALQAAGQQAADRTSDYAAQLNNPMARMAMYQQALQGGSMPSAVLQAMAQLQNIVTSPGMYQEPGKAGLLGQALGMAGGLGWKPF